MNAMHISTQVSHVPVYCLNLNPVHSVTFSRAFPSISDCLFISAHVNEYTVAFLISLITLFCSVMTLR